MIRMHKFGVQEVSMLIQTEIHGGTGTAVSVCYGSSTHQGYATRTGDCNDAKMHQ